MGSPPETAAGPRVPEEVGAPQPPPPPPEYVRPAGIPSEELPGTPGLLEEGPSVAPRADSGALGPLKQQLRGTATATTSASASLSGQASVAASLSIIPPKARAESANDQPTRSDSIGFKPYVDALAQFLMNEKTVPPLTVSLEGQWGSGKSSFIEQLEDAVLALSDKRRRGGSQRSQENPAIVRFNAWRHDRDEALWASFALEFARKVAPREFRKRLWRALLLIWRRLDRDEWWSVLTRFGLAIGGLAVALFVGLLVQRLFFPRLASDAGSSELQLWADYVVRWAPKVVPTTFLLSLLAKIVRLAPAMNVSKYLTAGPDYKAKVGFLERFHDDFALFTRTYVGDRRVLVFVDDLDRCEVPKAAELLHAVNLMLAGDLPLLVVLAMDRLKIAAGVALRHKELLGFLPLAGREGSGPNPDGDDKRVTGIAYGYEFVEKFVQLPLRVPRLTQDGLARLLDGLLNAPTQATSTGDAAIEDPVDVVASDGGQVRHVMEMVAPTLGFNPRRLKQFLNLFRLRHYVAANTRQLKVDGRLGWTLPQLGKIVAIELQWKELLDHLLDAPNDLETLCQPTGAKTIPADIQRWQDDRALQDLLSFKRSDDSAHYDMSGAAMPYLLGVLYGAGRLPRDEERQKEPKPTASAPPGAP